MANLKKLNDYNKEWNKIDSLANRELNKSALELVTVIYNKAKQEGNAAQFIKAIIYRMKLESQFEENALEKTILNLQSEVKNSKYPITPVLHSILAESYWQYYQNNRWQIYERSKTINFKNDDISTWDINKIVEQVIYHHQQSLANADKLKSTPVNLYDAIIVSDPEKEFRHLRPTLFDFIAHRALTFYTGHEPEVTRPANKFGLNEKEYFGNADVFANQNIATNDSLSLKFYALTILQELTRFHLNDKSPDALIDVELKRLKFVHTHSGLSDKSDLYLAVLNELEKKYLSQPVSTEVTYEIAMYHSSLGDKFDSNKGDEYKWEKKKAMEICDGAIKRFPESFGAKNCKYLQASIRSKSISIVCEEVNIPNTPFKALVNYKNIPAIYVRIAKLNDKESRRTMYNYNTESLIKHYLSLKPVAEFTTTLPTDDDYQAHSTEIKLPALDNGNYVVLTGTDKQFSYTQLNAVSFQEIWVSALSFVSRKNKAGDFEFYVLNRQSGEPMKGVTAQLWHQQYDYNLREYKYIKGDKFLSDTEGHILINAAEESRNYDLELIHNSDRLLTPNAVYRYHYNYKDYKQTRSFLFTDRAIYRPGQTIYFKGIMLEKDGDNNSLLTNTSTSVIFYDVNHQKISQQLFITNDFGTFNGSFTIPQGLLNGQMYLSTPSGSVYFSVEDYKRPKFDVSMNPVKGSYKLNDIITVTGKAEAYSGANIDGAKVSYRITRGVYYPSWFYWGHYFHYSNESTEILNGTTTTNDTGGFDITFKALPESSIPKENEPTFYFTVYADVTDINGETHSTETSVRVSYKSLELSLTVPQEFSKENIPGFSVAAANMNGTPESAKGNIVIYKLKQPKNVYRKKLWEKPDKFVLNEQDYHTTFPTDEYNDENNMFKWDKSEKVFEGSFESNTALDIKNISKWALGSYYIEANCKDKNGENVKAAQYFTIFSEKGKELPKAETFFVKSLKGSVQPGDKAQLLIGSAYNKAKVLYEIEHKNKIVKKEWITLSNEQKLVEIPVEEKHRGNFSVHFTFIIDNRCYKFDEVISVHYSNKDLKIEFETFRNKLLPGQQEEWKLKITGPKGEKVAAEMLATLYDASLDAFRGNYWSFNVYDYYYQSLAWQNYHGFQIISSSFYSNNFNPLPSFWSKEYDYLNWFGYSHYYYNNYYSKSKRSRNRDSEDGEYEMAEMAAPAGVLDVAAKSSTVAQDENQLQDKIADKRPMEVSKAKTESEKGETPAVRKNFNETAFFYPSLQTNEKGEVFIKFTIPEALTKWRMMGFAHTKDLMSGQISNELVTQKELMVVPNAPRFFRENDTIYFTSKITNLSDNDQNGTAKLELFDAISMKPLQDVINENYKSPIRSLPEEITVLKTPAEQNIAIKKGSSTLAVWKIKIPEGVGAITYRVTAKTNNHSDAEEMAIPVLTNRMLVTESMPLPIRSKQTKTFTFNKLITQSNNSTTLRNHKLTLEFTSNPAWYAVQALPYMMEYPYECAEQTFSRYYANSIAYHIANSSPKIKAVFDSWKTKEPAALLSNLEKNQELKALLLEETPWVIQSNDESERKKRLALLFDLNKMSNELNSAMLKLQQLQSDNGAWPWFKGMPEDRYITQHIVAGMGHLDRLGIKNIKNNTTVNNMLVNAIEYLDDRMLEDYLSIKKANHLQLNNLTYNVIHYLYARSFFTEIIITDDKKEAHDYFLNQAKKYWTNHTRYMEGMIALALNRYNEKTTAMNIIKALKENSINNEEMGMYWKENYEGYYWYQAPIETQAMMIEAFDEVANDRASVDGLKVWLLKSKQTEDWKTTKATAEACYALLLRGTQWLDTDVNVEITVGQNKIDPKKLPDTKVEAGTGYFKTSWSGNDIKPEMGNITISKSNEGVSWGAMYWQYFEQLDKITPHETPLKLKKQLFKEVKTNTGVAIKPIDANTALATGDKIKVRIELRVDRDMEYVHMKDMRASAFEPLNVFSGYRWQDGLGYYESTRDAATNFFFAYLPKGTYVFEYPLYVTHEGNFSNGVTTIQCMYAPEFTSHSEGVRVNIKK